MANCNFSYKHYRDILRQAIEAGFTVTNFRDFKNLKNSSKIIILRHDIDALPERHLELAKIENSLKIKSSYFVRVHGQYYHLSSKKTLKILEKIKKLGHEIGLHSEARVLAPVFKMDAIDLFKSEKEVLEETFRTKVLTASEHGDLGHAKNFWQNNLFQQISKQKLGIKNHTQEYPKHTYLSDSLSCWKNGCLCQNLTKYNLMQVLIHGEWWGGGAKKDMEKLNKIYANI